MSRPLTKDDLTKVQKEAEESTALIESRRPHLQPEADIYDKTSAAWSALVTSTGGIPSVKEAERITDAALSVVERKLKAFGCDFITSSYLLLSANKCPTDARDFVQIILAMSHGDSSSLLVITDDMIKDFSGLSKDTIIRKRKALKAWQFAENKCVVEIHEQQRSKETRHFKPTQYRVVYADLLVKFTIELRKHIESIGKLLPLNSDHDGTEPPRPALWDDMRKGKESASFAQTIKHETVVSIARKFGDENIPHDPIQPRKKYDHSNSSFTSKDPLASTEARIITDIGFCRDAARKRGRSAYSWWGDLKRKAALVLNEPTPGYPDPEED